VSRLRQAQSVERDSGADANHDHIPDTRYYALQDANYNTTAVVDSSGAIVERYEYDPYGTVTFEDASGTPISGNTSAIGWRVLYQGGRYDPTTGMYLFNASGLGRDYSPTLGRWIEQDPLGYVQGSNLYQIVASNPVASRDPYGLCGDCQPSPGPNVFGKHASGVAITNGDNPDKTEDAWEILDDLDTIGKISAAAEIMGSIAQGEISEIMTTAIDKGAENKMDLSSLAKGSVQNMLNNLKKHSYSVFVRVSWESCEPCTSANPLNWGGCPEYEIRPHHEWRLVKAGTLYGDGVFGPDVGTSVTSDDIKQTIEDVTR
jgi:RHS repeat-associated protein